MDRSNVIDLGKHWLSCAKVEKFNSLVFCNGTGYEVAGISDSPKAHGLSPAPSVPACRSRLPSYRVVFRQPGATVRASNALALVSIEPPVRPGADP